MIVAGRTSKKRKSISARLERIRYATRDPKLIVESAWNFRAKYSGKGCTILTMFADGAWGVGDGC